MDYLDCIGNVPSSTLVTPENSNSGSVTSPEFRAASKLWSHHKPIYDQALDALSVLVVTSSIFYFGKTITQKVEHFSPKLVIPEPDPDLIISRSGLIRTVVFFAAFMVIRQSDFLFSTSFESSSPETLFSLPKAPQTFKHKTVQVRVVTNPFEFWEGRDIPVNFGQDRPLPNKRVSFNPMARVRYSENYGDTGRKAKPWIWAPSPG